MCRSEEAPSLSRDFHDYVNVYDLTQATSSERCCAEKSSLTNHSDPRTGRTNRGDRRADSTNGEPHVVEVRMRKKKKNVETGSESSSKSSRQHSETRV